MKAFFQPRKKQHDPIVAVVGPTGSGKSNFIRLITGNTSVKIGSRRGTPCTEKVRAYSFVAGNKRFIALDTPGFDIGGSPSSSSGSTSSVGSTSSAAINGSTGALSPTGTTPGRTFAMVLDELSQYMAEVYPKGTKIAAILYLQPLHKTSPEGLPTPPILRNLRHIRRLCGGDDFCARVFLGTTFWSRLEQSEALRRERRLLLDRDAWATMRAYGSRAVRMPLAYQTARREALDLLFFVAGVEQLPGSSGGDGSIVTNPAFAVSTTSLATTNSSLPLSVVSDENNTHNLHHSQPSAQDMRKEARILIKQLEKEERAAAKAAKAQQDAERRQSRRNAKETQQQEQRAAREAAAEAAAADRRQREAFAQQQQQQQQQLLPAQKLLPTVSATPTSHHRQKPSHLQLPIPSSNRLAVIGSGAGDADDMLLPSPRSFVSARSLHSLRSLGRPQSSRDERGLPEPPLSARTVNGKPSVLVLETYVAQQPRIDGAGGMLPRSPLRTDYSPRDVQLSYQYFKPR